MKVGVQQTCQSVQGRLLGKKNKFGKTVWTLKHREAACCFCVRGRQIEYEGLLKLAQIKQNNTRGL